MANPGNPTTRSHEQKMDDLIHRFDGMLVEAHNICNSNRVAMAAGAVGDDSIKELWRRLASIETRIDEIRRASNFHFEYASACGLVYRFHSSNNVNAATDVIRGLPLNHQFLTDHPVLFTVINGALPGGLSEDTTYWIRTVGTGGGNSSTVTLSATEGGASDINLTNGSGRAWMHLDVATTTDLMMTQVDNALTEIETNLSQRGSTYGSRLTQAHTYSTRSTIDTAALRVDLQAIEDLIDTTP